MGASYLIHYGIKGQKHGLRRYQNEDGTYTEEGKRHYGIGEGPDNRQINIEEQYKKVKKGVTKLASEDAKRRRNEIKEMISTGRKNEVSKADKQQLKEDLKKGYKNRMKGALSTAAAGFALKSVGAIASVGLGHRALGKIMQVAGTVVIGSSVFKAAANTGAYFIGKNSINQGKLRPEDVKGR